MYDLVITELPRKQRQHAPQYASVRSALERQRARQMPRVPPRIEDIRIQGQWSMTNDGCPFLSRVNNYWGYAVFTTDDNLRAVGACNDFYIDATFKTTPKPYNQLLTIHGMYHDRVVPLIFALMHRRRVAEYRQVFFAYQTEVSLTASDFDNALLIAAETKFPHTHLLGCLFHFCQSMWKQVQRQELVRGYQGNADIRNIVRKVMALAFLLVALLRINFRLLL